MKNTFISAFATTLLLACGGNKTTAEINTTSEAKGNRQEARKESRQQFFEDLNLRIDQQAIVQAIVQESQKQMQEIRRQEGAQWEKLQQMRSVSEETDAKLMEVLDPEQYEVYETYKTEQRERMRNRIQHKRKNGGPDRF